MKSIKDHKASLKTMPDDLLYRSAKYTNKENDDFNRNDEKKLRFMDVNSPKGNVMKAKMLLQQQQMNGGKENAGKEGREGKEGKGKGDRKQQFEEARKRIQNLEDKIDNLRRYYNKTNENGNVKREKQGIFKTKSVENLPLIS